GEFLGLGATSLLGFWQQVEEVAQGHNCPAGEDLASTLVGVQLVNRVTQQLLNYQVITFDSRGQIFDGLYWSFVNSEGVTIYGVNDSLETLGMFPLEVGDPGKYRVVAVGLRVRELIKNNPWGLDTTLSDWGSAWLYGGSYTNGEARITSLQGAIQ